MAELWSTSPHRHFLFTTNGADVDFDQLMAIQANALCAVHLAETRAWSMLSTNGVDVDVVNHVSAIQANALCVVHPAEMTTWSMLSTKSVDVDLINHISAIQANTLCVVHHAEMRA